MMTTTDPAVRSMHASFFFVDIVGLSDPEMSTALQVRKIAFLNDSISQCKSFANAPVESTLVLPTGDGMAIGFLQGPELPLTLAMELHRKIRAYNRGKLSNELIQVRIGIHSGPIFVNKDVRGNNNVWGPGIIIARRVMDAGDDDHILVSSRVADDLRQLSHEYAQILHPLEKYQVKHNVQILIYSAYGSDFGNPKLPSKLKSQVNEFLYPYLEVGLRLVDPKTMRVHYKRTYEIQNVSDRPAMSVIHQIATDVEKSFDDLHIRVYDENGKTLRISSVELDTVHQKEFATSFLSPLAQGDKRRYFLEYEVEEPERYFENAFFTNCKKFVLTFDFPESAFKKRPVLYDVNTETGQKIAAKRKPTVTRKSARAIMRWDLDNVSVGKSVRVEW